ncbi:MAG: hypothetical protein AUJ72_00290 [Candidatus Omnitrophica bacterium CG1_02_46_14]|nr:MAG: hypothetical protein AUJ72_00290 [Candidatus Omnitrophica bacterium CG1_02_46_14]
MRFSKNFKPPQILLFFFISFLIASQSWCAEKQSVLVTEVLTGDTVRLEGGKTLKYIGIQAPPLQNIIVLVRQYGASALQFNKQMVQGKKVLVEWGSQIRDDHKNLLGYVYLPDGKFVNEEILKAGHAKLKITPPNIRYLDQFRKAELGARRKKLGVWKEEPTNPYLKSEYVGEKNTKIYYFPNSPELDRIPKANLVTFRSRVEAKAAGYRSCSSCSESVEANY